MKKIPDLVSTQKAAFRKGVNRSLKQRIANLKKLRKLVLNHEKELCNAIAEDFGKPYFETFTSEIFTVLQEIDFHLKHLSKWIKPENVSGTIATFPSKSTVSRQPYGTVLVIGAWNYPIYLTLIPMIGALSGGNTVVLKPSEISGTISGLLHELISSAFPNQLISVVEGGVPETQELLFQPFDKIFFTGSSRVGKIVAKAAAEQLIPITLELGGKSPAIVHSDANVEVSARRIWWGKTINAGQVCVAPDFVLIHESAADVFIKESRKTLSTFYAGDFRPGTNYARIVNRDHFDRLSALLEKSDVIIGGTANPDSLFIEPTLISAGWDDEIMKDEIFGPLLPMLTYKSEDEVIERLNTLPAPLALYMFTESERFQSAIFRDVPFGGGCVNETITHLANPNLPFGGVGQSGMGAYHGRYSFDTFTRPQAILKKAFWPDPDFRYPPFDDTKLKWFKKLFF